MGICTAKTLSVWEQKYYTICCVLCGILFAFELVEGKDTPKEKRVKEGDNKGGKTVGLLLRLCLGLYSIGKVVVLDSRFCILRGIVEFSSLLLPPDQNYSPQLLHHTSHNQIPMPSFHVVVISM